MEYFVIEVISYKDGTATKKAIYTKDSIKGAMATFFVDYGNALTNVNIKKATFILLDEDGIYEQRFVKNEEEEE